MRLHPGQLKAKKNFGPAHDSDTLEEMLEDELSSNGLEMLFIALVGPETLVVPSAVIQLTQCAGQILIPSQGS